MRSPTVSIVLCAWNSGKYLPHCLDCLVVQTFRDFEVILVDNGSTDGSLTDIEGRWPALDLKLVRLERNLGFAAANNIGARAARGGWLALLNTDAFPDSGWLEHLLRAAGENRGFSFFASRQIHDGTPGQLDGCGDVYHVSGLAWRRFYNCPADLYGLETEETFSASGAAALYDRQAFMDAGGFDEDFFAYVEDIDLGFRLRLKGKRCLYVPEAVVRHVGSASLGPGSDFALFQVQRNMVWCFVRNMPAGLLWRYLPAHLAANLIYLGYYTLRGKGRVLWSAKCAAVRGLDRVLQKRKQGLLDISVSNATLVSSMQKDWLTPYLPGRRSRST